MVGFENEPNASFLIEDDGSKLDASTTSTAASATNEVTFEVLKHEINEESVELDNLKDHVLNMEDKEAGAIKTSSDKKRKRKLTI